MKREQHDVRPIRVRVDTSIYRRSYFAGA